MTALLEKADGMPYGFARTATVEEAVRIADAAQDLDAAFAAREALASAAVHGGEPQKGLVAVTWCLGQLDAHPGRFDEHGTYWALKWLPGVLLDRPEFPLAEVQRVVDEAERRYAAAGEGADAVAKLRWEVPQRIGRLDEAAEGYRRWRLMPRSEYSDCRACDVAAEVDLALQLDEPERALDLARPLLAGRLTCLEEPGRVLGSLLEPLHRLGRHDEAERLHVWGLRLVRGKAALVGSQAEHVVHLVRTGRLDAAFELAAELVDLCDRGLFRVHDRMQVMAAAGSVVASWTAAGRGALPRALGNRPQQPEQLAAALAAEARETAAAFDARNGTTVVGEEVARRLAVRPSSAPEGSAAAPEPPSSPAPRPAAVAEPPVVVPSEQPLDAAALLALARAPHGRYEERRAAAERALAAYLAEGDAHGAARARRTLGEALLRLDRMEEGAAALEQAAADLSGDPAEQVLAAVSRARVAVGLTRDTQDEVARQHLELARSAAEKSQDRDRSRGLVLLLEAEWAVFACGADAGAAASGVAADEFAQARALLAAHPDDVQDAWGTEAFARAVVGDHPGAMAAASEFWELAQRSGKPIDLCAAAEVLVPLLVEEGRLDRAVDVLAVAQRAEEERGDLAEAARAAGTRAEWLLDLDRRAEALAAAWTAVDLFGAAGDRSGAAWARLTVARAFRFLDQDQNAFDVLSELVEQAAEDGDRELEGAVALDIARLNGDFGYFDEALAAAGRALRCLGPEEAESRCKVHRTLAQAHEARGDMRSALAAGDACVAELDRVEDPTLVAHFRQDQADRLVRAGQPDRALALYGQAREEFTRCGLPVAVALVDLGRAEAFSALRRPADAIAAAEQALASAEREAVPDVRAEALWALASVQEPDPGRYDTALRAYEEAGAPPEQLADLAARRDAALGKGRSRWRRR